MLNQELKSQLDNMKELYIYFPHPYLLFQMNIVRKQINIQNKKTKMAQMLSTNMRLPRCVKLVRKTS